MIPLFLKFCSLLIIVGIIQAKRFKGDELEKLQKVRYLLKFQILMINEKTRSRRRSNKACAEIDTIMVFYNQNCSDLL